MNGNEKETIGDIEAKLKELFSSIGLDDDDEDIDNTVVLTDEDGNDVEFEFLDLIEYGGEEYVVLLPTEDDAAEVVILKLEESEDSDKENYTSVDDDKTLQAVFNIFKDRFKDIFDFED